MNTQYFCQANSQVMRAMFDPDVEQVAAAASVTFAAGCIVVSAGITPLNFTTNQAGIEQATEAVANAMGDHLAY